MKVIQVGIGGMGNAWLRAVQASADVDYAGFVEINDTIANQQAAQYGLDRNLIFKTLEDALAALGAGQIDGVIDVTPPQFHQQVSLTALDAGIPVLSEKPLADTLDAAQAIAARSAETGVLHMVAQNRRYSVPVQTFKRALSEMGAISAVRVDFFKGPHFGGFREEMPFPLIIDMAIHHFDLMRFLLDSDPVSVYGRSWNPPWSWFDGDASALAVFEFASGVPVVYNGSWCATGRETAWNGNWRVDCARGVVVLEDDAVRVQRWTGVDGFTNEYTAFEDAQPVDMQLVDQGYLLAEFRRAVTQGTAPVTTCHDNIRSLQMVFDVVQACESGTVITHSGECHQ